MRKNLLISGIAICLIALWYVVSHAQNVSVPASIAQSALAQAKSTIDQDTSDINNIDIQLDNNRKYLASIQQQITDLNAQKAAKQAEIAQNQANISAIAAPPYSLQPAIDLINSNPMYGTLTPTPPACGGTGVICSQNTDCCSGTCYGTDGVNWTASTCQ